MAGKSFWTKLILVLTALCCTATLVSQRARLRQGQAELNRLMDQAAQLSQEVESLQADAAQADTPEGIRRIAREALGYTEAGEIRFVSTDFQ